MKVLVDMNLSPSWSRVLTQAGISSKHWSEIGAFDAPDRVIIEYAAANDFVILTQDLDFGIILALTHDAKPSVVQIRAGEARPQFIGETVIQALRQAAEELIAGAIVTIDPHRVRMSLLPLRAN